MAKQIQVQKDAKKKVEEALNSALDQMKNEADNYKNKYLEMEKYNQIIKGELVEAKKHIEKLHTSSDLIDEQRDKQKPKGDMTGIGFNEAECSKNQEEKSNEKIDAEKPSIEEPKEQIRSFRGRCFGCNKFGHIKRDCKGNAPFRTFSGYCFNCNGYGHKEAECRKPNQSGYRQDNGRESTVKPTCYKCNNIGHIAKYCKLQVNQERRPPICYK